MGAIIGNKRGKQSIIAIIPRGIILAAWLSNSNTLLSSGYKVEEKIKIEPGYKDARGNTENLKRFSQFSSWFQKIVPNRHIL